MSTAPYEYANRRLGALGGAPTRNIKRLVYDVGTLPNNTSVTTAHGLTATELSKVTRIMGRAYSSGAADAIPLPHAHGTEEVRLFLSATDITTTSVTANMSDYTDCVVWIDIVDD